MEVIRKPDETPTIVIGVRIEASFKEVWQRARKKAERDHVDMTAMSTKALGEVVKAILGTASKPSISTSNGASHEG
jgi:hypothetical protein